MAKRALISLFDKAGSEALARSLIERGYQLVASDGSAAYLIERGISVKRIEEVTGAPELFNGRVKSLHPLIHGAILFDRSDESQVKEAEQAKIAPIDIVIIDLYPSDKFDIGGPALLRAAAKNWGSVSVITNRSQYPALLEAIDAGSESELARKSRRDWAAVALALTATYDLEILKDFGSPLRYGENPHQGAIKIGSAGLAGAQVHQGQLSFNNFRDIDLAYQSAADHSDATAVIVKHGIPTGIASDANSEIAFAAALAADPVSAFGGVIATNCEIDEALATSITRTFFEVLAAPGFTLKALAILAQRPKLRVVEIPACAKSDRQLYQIDGGFLIQDIDQASDGPLDWRLVSGAPAVGATLSDLHFTWRAVARTRSNAIVIAADKKSIGIGAGSVNRLDAARLACARAGARAVDAVAASDGFFPFPDGLQVLIDAGVSAVVAPGGSIRDEAVIAAARAADLTLYLSDFRHFSHN